MSDRPSTLRERLPLLFGNACAVGLVILVISVALMSRNQTDTISNAGYVFFVTAVCLGPLGLVAMLTGWIGLMRDGAAKYCWFALAIGAFSIAIGFNFGLRHL